MGVDVVGGSIVRCYGWRRRSRLRDLSFWWLILRCGQLLCNSYVVDLRMVLVTPCFVCVLGRCRSLLSICNSRCKPQRLFSRYTFTMAAAPNTSNGPAGPSQAPVLAFPAPPQMQHQQQTQQLRPQQQQTQAITTTAAPTHATAQSGVVYLMRQPDGTQIPLIAVPLQTAINTTGPAGPATSSATTASGAVSLSGSANNSGPPSPRSARRAIAPLVQPSQHFSAPQSPDVNPSVVHSVVPIPLTAAQQEQIRAQLQNPNRTRSADVKTAAPGEPVATAAGAAVAATTTAVAGSVSTVMTDSAGHPQVIIKFLPLGMVSEQVIALCAPLGKVISCKVVKNFHTGESLGYAIVVFENALGANTAVTALNGTRVQDKTIRVELATAQHANSTDPARTNIYISGVPKAFTKEDLDGMFGQFGQINESRILLDANGAPRGLGFVRYESTASALEAIQCTHGATAPGGTEPMIVKFARITRRSNVSIADSAASGTATIGAAPITVSVGSHLVRSGSGQWSIAPSPSGSGSFTPSTPSPRSYSPQVRPRSRSRSPSAIEQLHPTYVSLVFRVCSLLVSNSFSAFPPPMDIDSFRS